MNTYLYQPKLRPAGRYTLPPGVAWTYVEAPAMFGLCNRPDLPQSSHRYGVIAVDRELTKDECFHFDLLPLPA